MKIKNAKKYIDEIATIARKDNDTFFITYFSREDDKFKGIMINVDIFDAQIMIDFLKKYAIKKLILPPFKRYSKKRKEKEIINIVKDIF